MPLVIDQLQPVDGEMGMPQSLTEGRHARRRPMSSWVPRKPMTTLRMKMIRQDNILDNWIVSDADALANSPFYYLKTSLYAVFSNFFPPRREPARKRGRQQGRRSWQTNRCLPPCVGGFAPGKCDQCRRRQGLCLWRRAQLAQLAMTGTRGGVYQDAQAEASALVAAAMAVEPRLAQTAVHVREKGHMKDTPALLLAVLSARDPALFAQAFGRVVTSGKVLRGFVQILRSGQTGRKSPGSRPKAMVQLAERGQ